MLSTNLQNYLIYLNFIQNKLNKYFEAQSPFIFCKSGCGMCCHNQQFPFSQIEAEYLLLGFAKLPPETFEIVNNNLINTLQKKKDYTGNEFRYDCPFLINDSCSNYEYRGLVCRSFGLMLPSEDGNLGVPFCCFKGLNYSNVVNFKTYEISQYKYKKLKTDKTPNAYNVSYKFLVNDDFAKGFNFEFGEIKPMIDWLEIFHNEVNQK